jgi:hypothetical protein
MFAMLLSFPALAVAVPSAGEQDYVPGQLLVKFRHNTPARGVAVALRTAGAELDGRIPNLGVQLLHVSPSRVASTLQELESDPRVAFAERDALLSAQATPNDYWWPSEWAPSKVNAPSAWDSTTGSASTVIAVLDSGVDFSQPDLQGAFVAGHDIVNSDNDPSDDYGHGTQVAGVAAARSNNAIGVASYCWRCSIMPVKVLGANGTGSVSDVAAGITWASDHGARVINMSLGSTSASSTLASAAQYAHDHGAVLVAAAGNSGSTTQTYPAALPTVIGVAGTDSADQLTSTSNYGSWVKVAAPGCNFTTGLNSWYGTFCGTSSASPVVAGVAALALSLDPGATNTQVEQAIEASAVPESFVQYGRVDAAATLAALGGTSGAAPGNDSPPTISGTAEDGSTLSASTGSWSGSPSGYAFQWQRCDSSGGSCGKISGATSQSYAETSADVGSTIRVTVTAGSAYGSSSATSAPSAVVAAAPAAQTQTTTFTGTITNKQRSQGFSLAMGSGVTAATLTFAKASSLTLTLIAPDGSTVGTINGASGIQLTKTVSPGSYRYTVSGSVSKGSASFTLAVSYPPPS